MPESKRPLKVFLCHAHSDQTVVRSLYNRLTKDGVEVWLDKEKLLPGQDWELEIRKAVREADVVVVCLSKQFNQAGFRQKEVKLALDTAMEQADGEIFIIPARLEECDNLESLRKWHWVNLFEDDGYEMLMRAFRARANRIGATLQAKKNWLPVIAPHRADVETKKSFALNKDKLKEKSGIKEEKTKAFDEVDLQKEALIENTDRENEKSEVDEKDNHQKPVRQVVERVALAKTISKFVTTIKSLLPKPIVFIGIIIIGLALLGSWAVSNLLVPIPTATHTKALTTTLTPKPPSPTGTFTLTASPLPTITKTSTPTPRVIGGDTFDRVMLLGKITPESGGFTSADISPDGQIVAVSLYNGTVSSIQLWRVEDLTLLKTLDTQGQYITNILFSPDGSLLASGDRSGTLKIWMVKTGEQTQSLNDTAASIQKIGFSKDGRKLIVSTISRIEVWNIETGTLISAVNMRSNQRVVSFAIDPNDKIGYSIYEEYVVRYVYPWNPDTQKYSTVSVPEWGARYITSYGKLEEIEQLPQLSDVNFSKVFDFSQDGEMLLGVWGRISILNFSNKEVKSFDQYSYNNTQAVFSPDDRSIAISAYSNLSLLRISDGEIERISTPHKYSITNLVFSQNGWVLITSSSDSLGVWGIPRWNSTPTPTTAPPTAVQ